MSFVLMDVGDMSGEISILLLVGSIENKEDVIESGHKCGRKVDVLSDRDLCVVSSVEGIGSGKDGGSGIERGGDSGLCN